MLYDFNLKVYFKDGKILDCPSQEWKKDIRILLQNSEIRQVDVQKTRMVKQSTTIGQFTPDHKWLDQLDFVDDHGVNHFHIGD